ncbi:hypothetical protein [Gordonia sp. 852002-51296_SCH5728562-b]|uniref:hypothetical protein n=1 Tax=Gordonia sp. 852002-51296_SCH5728562-b TaxID=1834101 RepID=UPI0007EBF058|nr:hypothetical protein [Gordonia sp. 852002-51296_SCH5728562-b]OBA38980.1 hypothetical protein A5766_04290 [Gordonia sp. 852002-51296_SCH5728562-b]
MTAMTLHVHGRDLSVGDRIIRFTNDADVIVTGIEATASGGIVLSLDVVDVPGDSVAGSTYFITGPDAIYTVDRP